jgi:hypothetical protein
MTSALYRVFNVFFAIIHPYISRIRRYSSQTFSLLTGKSASFYLFGPFFVRSPQNFFCLSFYFYSPVPA